MPVYDGETVGDFCARVVGVPRVDSSVELLWGTILLPENEALQQLVITRPWQIDFRLGMEKLLLRLPPGVQPSREMEKYMKIKEVVVEPPKLEVAPAKPAREQQKVKAAVSAKRKRSKASCDDDEVLEDDMEAALSGLVSVKQPRIGGVNAHPKSEAVAEVARDPSPVPLPSLVEVRMIREAMDELRRPCGTRKMRPLVDFYADLGKIPEDAYFRKVPRHVQVADRYHSFFLNDIPDTGEEADLAHQLTALSDQRPSQRASYKKVTRVPSSLAAPAHPYSNYLGMAAMRGNLFAAMENNTSAIAERNGYHGLPGSMPIERMKAVIFQTSTIGDVVAKMKRQADEYQFDMSRVQSSTFGCLYYMRLINEALQSIALLPGTFADSNSIAKIRQESSTAMFMHDCHTFS